MRRRSRLCLPLREHAIPSSSVTLADLTPYQEPDQDVDMPDHSQYLSSRLRA
jgi:hypothetical protein